MTPDLKQIVEKEAETQFPNWTGVGSAYRHGFIKGANFALTLNKWVDVNQELPEERNWYLGYNSKIETTDLYYFNKGKWHHDTLSNPTVTHWQPLPDNPPVQP